MVTFLHFLSLCFNAALSELYEGLEVAVQLALYKVCGLDLLQSPECIEELLCEEELLCGVSHQ